MTLHACLMEKYNDVTPFPFYIILINKLLFRNKEYPKVGGYWIYCYFNYRVYFMHLIFFYLNILNYC